MPFQRSAILISALCAAVAGFADSDAYLRWHQFAANMTGNTVLLGIAVVSRHLDGVWDALMPIVAFTLGSAAAQASLRFSPALLLLAEAALLAGAALAQGYRWQLAIVAVAMGLQNTTVQSFDPVGANTSFITGDYARIGQAAVALLSGTHDDKERRTLAVMVPLVVSYVAGAAAAAVLLAHRVPHAVLVCVPILIGVAYAVRRVHVAWAQHG